MTGFKKFHERFQRKKNCSSLTSVEISDEEYEYLFKVCNKFGLKKIQSLLRFAVEM